VARSLWKGLPVAHDGDPLAKSILGLEILHALPWDRRAVDVQAAGDKLDSVAGEPDDAFHIDGSGPAHMMKNDFASPGCGPLHHMNGAEHVFASMECRHHRS
jgi:hypothetical protein